MWMLLGPAQPSESHTSLKVQELLGLLEHCHVSVFFHKDVSVTQVL